MAKSLRSKRKKRLRTLRREIAEPFYEKKEEEKLAAQEAALAAPKLLVRMPQSAFESMDVETGKEESSQGQDSNSSLKPKGVIGKKKLKTIMKKKKDARYARKGRGLLRKKIKKEHGRF